VLDVFHSNPSNFAPVASVSALLVEKGDIDEAYRLLSSVADPVISQNNAGPLLEALRRIWSAAPKHIPTLELIHRLCERTADELTLPEVLEALGRVHEEAGNLEKAEEAYLKLSAREPENENYRGLLNAVQRKLGREFKPVDFATKEIALATVEEEIPREPAGIDTKQELMVKEALENSDLFSRYNLTEKAIAELEKVLQVYPDQVEIHRRILEISRKGFPERAAAAAAQLARISTEHGDGETAGAYHAIASAKDTLHEIPLPPPPPGKKVEEPAAPPPAPPEKSEAEKTAEFPIPLIAPEEPVAAPAAPAPVEVPFDLTPPQAPSEPPAAPPPPPSPIPPEQATELDLSGDLEAMAGFGFEAPAPSVPELIVPPPVEITAPVETPAPNEEAAPAPVETPAPSEEAAPPPVVEEATPPVEIPTEVPEPPPGLAEEEETIPVDLEDSLIEVEFYLENGFIDEARKAVAVLEEKYPESPLAAALRQRLDERVAAGPSAEPSVQVVSEDEAVVAEPPAELVPVDEAPPAEPPIEVVHAEPEVAPPPELAPVAEKPVPVASPPEPAPVAEKPVPVAASPEPAPIAEEPTPEEWELPTSYAVTPEPEPAMDPVVPPPVAEPEPPPPVAELATPPPAHQPVVEEPVAVESGGTDMLGDLAGDLATSLDELAVPEDVPAPPAAVPFIAAPPPAASPQGAAQLDGLLAEMEDPGAAAAAKGDPETHYNLGVAFREMALLDEAIGEFQKVVKGSGKGNYPANFLQACSLLAICFMEKKMPAIAVKWYLRAMETPGLDEEAQMALQYDLGLAYEQAGDSRNALQSFTEVYSQNIDFRDVAEKIREHQQKA
jgi:tetratricopeptide (TPR) repeat protein